MNFSGCSSDQYFTNYDRKKQRQEKKFKDYYNTSHTVGVFNLLPDTIIVLTLSKRPIQNDLLRPLFQRNPNGTWRAFIGYLAKGQAFYEDYTPYIFKYKILQKRTHYVFIIRSKLYLFNIKQLVRMILPPYSISVMLDENFIKSANPLSLSDEKRQKAIDNIMSFYYMSGKPLFRSLFLYNSDFLE